MTTVTGGTGKARGGEQGGRGVRPEGVRGAALEGTGNGGRAARTGTGCVQTRAQTRPAGPVGFPTPLVAAEGWGVFRALPGSRLQSHAP